MMLLLFSMRNEHLFGKELLILFTVFVSRVPISICACAPFPFAFKCGVWDLIALLPEHCLSIYFSL